MATNTSGNDRWYFTKEQLETTPSQQCGYTCYKELSYRQQTANFIQDMGQKLKVSQLCINTAIVYMHRFYVFHSFTNFPWHQMAAAALFLAAKVEEQPRKLEYVIRVANMCRNIKDTNVTANYERYAAQSQDLVFNENVLLQTLGFDVAIDHPHTHVVRCCHLVKASKDLAQSSYFLASNSLHLTTMCLQYKPTVVACFCIHLACKWSSWEIPLSKEKKEWFLYVDPTVTAELLQQLTEEFLSIFESCPSRLKEKIMAIGDNGMHNTPNTIVNSPFDTDPKKIVPADVKDAHSHRSAHDGKSGEKREREKMAAQHGLKAASSRAVGAHGHHRSSSSSSASVDPKMKAHVRPLASAGGHPPPSSVARAEPRDILREASRDSPFGIATKEFRDVPAGDNKDTKSRDFSSIKSSGGSENASYGSYNGDNSKQQRPDANRSDPGRLAARALDPNKVPMKHEQARRHEHGSSKSGFTRPSASSASDDNNKQRHNATSNVKVERKSPFEHVKSSSSSTSVPRPQQQVLPTQQQSSSGGGGRHHHNGGGHLSSHDLSINNTMFLDGSIKAEVLVKEEPVGKKPSLFSPEKSPGDSHHHHQGARRARNASTSSEPELRPVLKKIDQVEGFENLMRDASIGINKLHLVPEIITPIADNKVKADEQMALPAYSKEMRPPDLIPPLSCSDLTVHNNNSSSGLQSMLSGQPYQQQQSSIVNGRETDPALISSLLKEAPTVPHLPVGSTASAAALQNNDTNHHHHKSKKKNKEKHKHKDKSRDDKEKKKKHKDKDRDKHNKHSRDGSDVSGGDGGAAVAIANTAEPIKIRIQKDKIQNPLKIKIKQLPDETPPPPSLKIKIPKDKISNCSDTSSSATLNNSSSSSSSRKRERDRSSPGDCGPPVKLSRSGHNLSSSGKQNGRHSSVTSSSSSSSTTSSSKVSSYQTKVAPSIRSYQQQQQQAMTQLYQQQQHNQMYYYGGGGQMAAAAPAYMYPADGGHQMYSYYANAAPFMYAGEMYHAQPPPPTHHHPQQPSQQLMNAGGGGGPPPLPMDAPPVIPPPPPPE